MENGREVSFWDLYKNNMIRIPQIQRDYVQGRDNAKVKVNRSSFIKELIDSVKNDKQIILNFIYGYYEGECFIPIDGQQRLTTLFILYLLVCSKAGHKEALTVQKKINFSYETRYTTDRFIAALLENSEEVLSKNDIKNSITEASWYSFGWNSDPSIESIITMLSEILEEFGDQDEWEKYYNSLTSNSCPIRFMILEMKKSNFGKPAQLYIRMNARGKQLTDFENFKASLYDYTYNNKAPELDEFIDKIKGKIDNEWHHEIWKKTDEKIAEKYTDTFYREIIHWIFVNRLCVNRKLDKKDEWVKPGGMKIEEVFLENYVDISETEFPQCIRDLWHAMQTLCKHSDTEIVKEMLKYDEGKNKCYESQISGYKQRVKLFAITKFGLVAGDDENDNDAFNSWVRIIDNLTKNTEIDDPEIFSKVCQSIEKFEKVLSIQENPEDIKKLDGFANYQIEEEIFKLNIFKHSDELKEAIIEAEKNAYFQGEILFSLMMAGIYDTSNVKDKVKEYKEIWETISKVINFAKENDNLFHRALLTYGDYSKEAPGGVGERGVMTYFRYMEKHHKYDWRGMLRPEKNKLGDGAQFFLEFIKHCKKDTPEKVAKQQIEEYRINKEKSQENINYYLITEAKLFEYCKNYYYVWHDKEGDWNRFLLMKTSKRNTYVEAKAFVLSLLLSKSIEYKEGGYKNNLEDRRSYAVDKETEKIYEIKNTYFVDKNGKNFLTDLGEKISDPEVLRDIIERKKSKANP